MELFDTHSHLYLEEFDSDRPQALERAALNGVKKIMLPNVDETTWGKLLETCKLQPNICLQAVGIHPCSIHADFKQQIEWVEKQLLCTPCDAIGEVGIDLYWSKEYHEEQKSAFRTQLKIAKETNLPIIIHNRESFEEVLKIVNEEQNGTLKGVFHCFSGDSIQAKKIIDLGFFLGIGGVVSYKNSKLPSVLEKISAKHLLLETDSPYLPPVPYRGKRNESSYLSLIAQKIAEVMHVSTEEIAKTTSSNACRLFNIQSF